MPVTNAPRAYIGEAEIIRERARDLAPENAESGRDVGVGAREASVVYLCDGISRQESFA